MIQIPYVEPVFRPPSEAYSLILQVTIGCSWNNCTFCEMYTQPQKRFRFKQQEQIEQELAAIAATGSPVRRIFLADGDAMTLSYRRLKMIMQAINRYLPGVQRVSSYCLPTEPEKQDGCRTCRVERDGSQPFLRGLRIRG